MRPWLLAMTCALAIGTACAQDAQQPQAAGTNATSPREACKEDFTKFCSTVQPGGGRLKECMKAHKDELSPTCRDALTKVASHRPAQYQLK